ncbi:MAG: SCO family protein [Phycisphaeraceae bacterium]|nr:SCO family protein [Phycisphaeraceae bacterium]MCB9847450.1 SCO family protein [Phycisphaeraceae bacterium]
MSHRRESITTLARRLLTPALCCALSSSALAQAFLKDGPEEFQGVDITEHRGDTIPLDVPLTTADGRQVNLKDYIDGEKPVVLILAYYTCPMQCQLVLNSAMDAFGKLKWDLGDEYRALTISFDPRDTTEYAAQWKTDLYRGYEHLKKKPVDDNGWEFFTAKEADSKAVADAVGFGYKFVPKAGDYAHPSVIMVLTPDGEISNYLYGVHYEPDQLTLALQDAGSGNVGSLYDRVLFRCFLFDPDSNSYVANAMLIMRISGGLTVFALGGGVGLMLWQSRRKAKRKAIRAANQEHDKQPAIGAKPLHA